MSSSKSMMIDILFQNEHYIVINKPHDVRMDGDFNTTIKSLLVDTFPGTNTESFKWVHQLDFATSGALCIAKNREAAALACLAFELRETTKEYIAVVEGHIDTSSWPICDVVSSLDNIKLSLQQLHDSNSNINNDSDTTTESLAVNFKKKKGDSCSSQNSSTDWQNQVMSQNLQLCLSKLSTYLSQSSSSSSSSSSQTDELQALSTIPYQNYCCNYKLRKRLRKGLKSVGIELDDRAASIDPSAGTVGKISANIYNNSDSFRPRVSSIDIHLQELWRDRQTGSSQEYIFRAAATENHSKDDGDTLPLLVAVPLVEPLEDFRMDILSTSSSTSSSSTCSKIRGIYSETWVHVLERGYYQVSNTKMYL